MSLEWDMALCMFIKPRPPGFQPWKVCPATAIAPVSSTTVLGVTAPVWRAAAAVTILKVDPGSARRLTRPPCRSVQTSRSDISDGPRRRRLDRSPRCIQAHEPARTEDRFGSFGCWSESPRLRVTLRGVEGAPWLCLWIYRV